MHNKGRKSTEKQWQKSVLKLEEKCPESRQHPRLPFISFKVDILGDFFFWKLLFSRELRSVESCFSVAHRAITLAGK